MTKLLFSYVPPCARWVVSVWCPWSRFSLNWIERETEIERDRDEEILIDCWSERVASPFLCASSTSISRQLQWKVITAASCYSTGKTKRFNIVLILNLLSSTTDSPLFFSVSVSAALIHYFSFLVDQPLFAQSSKWLHCWIFGSRPSN